MQYILIQYILRGRWKHILPVTYLTYLMVYTQNLQDARFEIKTWGAY